MPSRLGVVGILLFWIATTGYILYREVGPRWFFDDGPPPLRIDLVDEAAQAVPTKWSIYRGTQKVGALSSRMEYVAADDTFRFVNQYQRVNFDFEKVTILIPRLETRVRVTRAGELREQELNGDLEVLVAKVKLGGATANVESRVVDGQLVGQCQLTNSPFGNIDRPLDPVPVRAGEVLHPMMPVNRLQDVRPGRRWTVRVADPLQESMLALFEERAKQSPLLAAALPRRQQQEWLAEVSDRPETLERKSGERVECWVIEYRTEEIQARTWVNVVDGRVMRQEATFMGEHLVFERDE